MGHNPVLGNPGSLSASPPGGTSSARNDHTSVPLSFPDMPYAISRNSTGGVTTSPFCGTDPLAVPARVIVSPTVV